MLKPRLPHDIDYYKKKRHEEIRQEGVLKRAARLAKRRKGFLVALAVALIIVFLPQPDPVRYGDQTIPLTREGKAAIALLALFILVFVTEAMPFGMTMALVYSWIVFFGIVPARRAADLFSHDAIWFLAGALMIASVLIKQGIHTRALGLIVRLVGSRIRWVIFGIVLFCGTMSMFIAGHTMAAFMLPVGIAIVDECGGYHKVPRLAKCLMLAIAFGSSIGGLATPSGGGRNVIMIGYLQDFFDTTVSYKGWLVMAAPITLVLIPLTTVLLLLFCRPEVDHIDHIRERIQLKNNEERMSLKQWVSVGIFLLVLSLWILKSDLGIGMIAMFGSILYFLLGLADWEDFQKINWSTVMLYFAAIGLGRALQETQATRWIAANILNGIRHVGMGSGFPLTAGSSFFMTGMTQTMSDGPCVASMGPMLLETANLAGNDPVVFGIAIAIASAFAFAVIIGTPPNAIVHGSGYVKAKDFLKVGILLSLLAYGLLLLTMATWWKIIGAGAAGFH
jgi:sodium-dependent dicarboxylate transporter 2/3/5